MKKPILYLAIALLIPLSAQAEAVTGAPARDGLMLGIYEGVAEQKDFAGMQDKYAALTDFLSKTLQKTVKPEANQNMNSVLNNFKSGRYTLLFSKPSNVAALAIRDQNYQLVAMADGEFTVSFIVQAKSPLKKPEDIRGKNIAIAMGTFVETAGMAELRDRGLTPAAPQVKPTRFQDAVAFLVEQGYADVGVVSPPVAKAWQAKGGGVLFQSRKMPYWSLTASPAVSKGDVEKLRSALAGLGTTEEGKKLLGKLGVQGFVPGNRQDFIDLLNWLAKK